MARRRRASRWFLSARGGRCVVAALFALAGLVACDATPDRLPGAASGTDAAAATTSSGDGSPPGQLRRRALRTGCRLVATQLAALRRHDDRGFADTWSSPPRGQRVATALDQQRVAVTGLRLDPETLETPDTASPGRTSWQVDVSTTWRTGRLVAHSTVTYTFTRAGHGAVLAVRPARGQPAPAWLLSGVAAHIDRSGSAVVAAPRRLRDLSRYVATAERGIRQVLPTPTGRFVTYLPRTRAGFDAVLAAAPGEYDEIAGVTTTVDGSHAATAPIAVVLNPDVWPSLSESGRRVVMTHEATHAATGSVTVDLPRWVSEGFADYVAVSAAGLPLRVGAGATLRHVRGDGAPARLPPDSAFARTGPALDRAYALSRLAMRTIAERYGPDALVAFYRRLLAHPQHIGAALRAELDTSLPALTRQWQRDLLELAGAH